MNSKKRKAAYIDRAQVLSDRNRKPNVHEGVVALSCDGAKLGSIERRFSYKLSVPGDDNMLDALVLENGICCLVRKQSSIQSAPSSAGSYCKKVEFPAGLVGGTEKLSGRMKKGAAWVGAGSRVCTVQYKTDSERQRDDTDEKYHVKGEEAASGRNGGDDNDCGGDGDDDGHTETGRGAGEEVDSSSSISNNNSLSRKSGSSSSSSSCCSSSSSNNSEQQTVKLYYNTPVGGQLLEFNDNLLQHPHWLSASTAQHLETYIAVVFPDTEIPHINGAANYDALLSQCVSKQQKKEQQAKERGDACFAFRRGECTRGDKCKFTHSTITAATVTASANATASFSFVASDAVPAATAAPAPDAASAGGGAPAKAETEIK